MLLGRSPSGRSFWYLWILCFGFFAGVVAAPGSGLKISFFEDKTTIEGVVSHLRRLGVEEGALGKFQSAAEAYATIPLKIPASKLPGREGGFYYFKSEEDLAAAFPQPLDEVDREFQLNCFETAILITEGRVSATIEPDAITGPHLVPHSRTNDLIILPVATTQDAFTLLYPQWYREVASQQLGPPTDRRINLNTLFFAAHVLPLAASEQNLEQVIQRVLKAHWRRGGVRFGPDLQVVLCHEINLAERRFTTGHCGVLFKDQGRKLYVEKAGGRGPFVLLAPESETGLLEWLQVKYKGRVSEGTSHVLVTFNDEKIVRLLLRVGE